MLLSRLAFGLLVCQMPIWTGCFPTTIRPWFWACILKETKCIFHGSEVIAQMDDQITGGYMDCWARSQEARLVISPTKIEFYIRMMMTLSEACMIIGDLFTPAKFGLSHDWRSGLVSVHFFHSSWLRRVTTALVSKWECPTLGIEGHQFPCDWLGSLLAHPLA